MAKSVEDIIKSLKEIADQKANPEGTADDTKLAAAVEKHVTEPLKKVREERAEKVAPRVGFDVPRRANRYGSIMTKRYPEGSIEKRVQDWNDDVLLAAASLRESPASLMKRIPDFREFLEKEMGLAANELEKAMSSSAGVGLEWIPTVFSPELQELVRIERALTRAFRSFPMGANPMKLPQLTVDMSAFTIPESTTDTAFQTGVTISQPTTANLLLEAVKIGVASRVSDELNEDSIVPALPMIRGQIVLAVSGALENAIINGSKEAVHPDTDIAAIANHPAKAWNGLRASAQGQDFLTTSAQVDLNAANMTIDNLLRLIQLQGRFGSKPSESMWLTSPQGVVKLMGVKDASGIQVLVTADKFGAQNLLMEGAVGQVMGRPVLLSDFVKTNLNATGVADGAGGSTFTELILANTGAFIVGDRRELRVESERVIGTGQTLFVASGRWDFKRHRPGQSAADRPVTIGVKIATT